jgi:hypothetical protein
VQNGERYVVAPQESATWYLLDRAGGRSAITPPANSIFTIGTPNGWLLSAPDSAIGTQSLHTFVVTDTGLLITDHPVGAVPRDYLNTAFTVAYADPLTGTGFPAPVPSISAPPAPPPAASSLPASACAGFTPLLAPNMNAQVTPGQPNRMRSMPSLSGAIVTIIPGGATVRVLNGPFCEGSIGFWLVDYAGTVGYTAEGNGADYYLLGIAGG